MSTTSSAEKSSAIDNELDCEQYWRVHCYYKILDVTIVNLKRRFSDESLELAQSVDDFLKFDYFKSFKFINHYKVVNTIQIKVVILY